MGKTFPAAQLTHERFLTVDHSYKNKYITDIKHKQNCIVPYTEIKPTTTTTTTTSTWWMILAASFVISLLMMFCTSNFFSLCSKFLSTQILF